MKLGFIFDVKFTEYNGHYYAVNLTEDLWQTRYLQVFDEIVVIGRSVHSDKCPEGRLVQSDMPRVSFRCIENTNPIKRVFRLQKESEFICNAISDCDAVICRGWWGVKECRQLRKNYMFEVISCVWDSMWNHSFLGKCVALPYFLLQKQTVKNAPYVLYVTKKFLQKRYPTKGIQFGITDTELPPETDTDILVNRMTHIKNDHKTVLLGTCAAVNVAYKGQKYVIKALALLKKRGFTNYKYQMVGNGDQTKLRRYAQKLGVADQIEFLGGLPHDRVFDWLDTIDIYVQPSFQEGLSRAVVEAMSRGLPCIVSDAGGNPELIEPEFVCKRHFQFAEQIAESVLQMDIDKQRVCAQRNYQTTQEFSPDKVNEQRILFMKAFVEKKSFVEV